MDEIARVSEGVSGEVARAASSIRRGEVPRAPIPRAPEPRAPEPIAKIAPTGSLPRVEVDAISALSNLTNEPPIIVTSISQTLYDFIRPAAPRAALLKPTRLMMSLDVAIAALSDRAPHDETMVDFDSLGLAALVMELDHHREVAKRRAEDQIDG